jgi:uncharacterized membrane protein
VLQYHRRGSGSLGTIAAIGFRDPRQISGSYCHVGVSSYRSWYRRSQRCGDALCRALSEPICGPFDSVADAPFARPFGVADGYIGAAVYTLIAVLMLAPPGRWVWIALVVLSGVATLANIVGVRDMMNLGSFCFYCLLTTLLSPVLIWVVWQLR